MRTLHAIVTLVLLASGPLVRAQPAPPAFVVRFEAPDVVAVDRQRSRRVEAAVLIETQGLGPGEPGAQGWSIFVSAIGCDVVGATTAGTAAEGAGFEKSEVTACRCPEGYTGALSSVLLSLTGMATLPVESPASVLSVTLAGSPLEDGACAECELDVVEFDNCNRCHTGEPITTSITYNGEGHSPEVVSRIVRFCPPRFHRGDVNGDRRLELSDAIAILAYLFLDGATPGCRNAADGNDDGQINIADVLFLVNYLFLGGPQPPAPGPPPAPCGSDPDVPGGSLGCESPGAC